ncbi:O-antigen polymerase [Dyella monticola]|uniref:O-antigen polymerase n=1 Tax=Dyella monticola TaxID=1927958 RepID=A0A370X5E5_9GAMM|nr:O-antigen ligase family protein [Dyella monticola]RDS83649.1 O-antigen polymerase [Dyella monticola]
MFPLIILYLVLTIIRPQEYMAAFTGIPILPIVLIAAFLCWLISSAKTFAAPQFVILPIFLVVLMISVVVNGWFGGALDQLEKFGPIMIAFFVLATACNTQQRVIITMAVFVLCSVVLVAHGIGQARTGMGWTGVPISEDGRIQYVGIFNDPNDLGLLFATTIPMAVFLSTLRGLLLRLFWLACAALLFYGTYLTNSRGALLAVLVVAGVYIWYRRGFITAGTLGVVGLACMKLMSSRMQDLDPDEESAFGRVDAWYEGLHMFLSHPVFGVGAGNFTEYNDLTAHNSFVLVLAETGFIGYMLWLAFVGYGFWMMLTVLRYKPDGLDDSVRAKAWQGEQRMALTLLLSLCGLYAAAFFLSRSYTVVMYLLAATVVGYYVNARQRFPGLRMFRLADSAWRWFTASLGSIAVFFVLVALLLHVSA